MADVARPDNRYKLLERLASGRTTELFLASARGEHDFEKSVVIKRLLPELELDAAQRAIFAEEAKLGGRLIHAKIANTIELGRTDNVLFMALEYVDGLDLIAVLQELALRERRLEPQLAAWIVHELLDALDYAHNLSSNGKSLGIVHRDVSPGNIMLSKRGDVKLVDFGIGRVYGPESGGDRSKAPNGRTGYMSPEQVSMGPTDPRSDVFSAGIVLAELLTGHPLFIATTERELVTMVRSASLGQLDKHNVGIDPALLAIVRKALDKSVAGRWASAAELRDALGEWLFSARHRASAQQIADLVAELREPGVAVSRVTTPLARGPVRPPVVAPKVVPPAPDNRPPRVSTRGKLHVGRSQGMPPLQPYTPRARAHMASAESVPLDATASAVDSIGNAVAGWLDRPRTVSR